MFMDVHRPWRHVKVTDRRAAADFAYCMRDLVDVHYPRAERIRVVTAASLFDGHDAAINIMRRLLQAQGAEVIHLGHDRSVEDIAQAAVQEDAHAVAVSSYQGGHMEFFRYLLRRLGELGASSVRVYGGGGGTITAEEARALEADGVARIFRPEDGRSLGLEIVDVRSPYPIHGVDEVAGIRRSRIAAATLVAGLFGRWSVRRPARSDATSAAPRALHAPGGGLIGPIVVLAISTLVLGVVPSLVDGLVGDAAVALDAGRAQQVEG